MSRRGPFDRSKPIPVTPDGVSPMRNSSNLMPSGYFSKRFPSCYHFSKSSVIFAEGCPEVPDPSHEICSIKMLKKVYQIG